MRGYIVDHSLRAPLPLFLLGFQFLSTGPGLLSLVTAHRVPRGCLLAGAGSLRLRLSEMKSSVLNLTGW